MKFICIGFLFSIQVAFAFDQNYAAYASVLERFVDNGRVDYAGLRDAPDSLDNFLKDVAGVEFDEYNSWRRETKMAFLVNLYNAAMLRLVITHYPIATVQDIGGFFSSPWNEKFIGLFGHSVSLGQILNDILRPEFKEPRLHFVIVNASKGCPALASSPYKTETMEKQLTFATRHYVLDRTDMNHWEHERLWLSPIFNWYQDDFGGQAGIRVFVQEFIPTVQNETELQYSHYDWSLNGK